MAKKKKATQPRLPEMADAKLEALHDAALSYAEIRDQRQELTQHEVELKGDLLKLMHKFKKTHYEYNGVEIDLVTESETVKVRVHKAKEEDVNVSVDDDFDPGETEESDSVA